MSLVVHALALLLVVAYRLFPALYTSRRARQSKQARAFAAKAFVTGYSRLCFPLAAVVSLVLWQTHSLVDSLVSLYLLGIVVASIRSEYLLAKYFDGTGRRYSHTK